MKKLLDFLPSPQNRVYSHTPFFTTLDVSICNITSDLNMDINAWTPNMIKKINAIDLLNEVENKLIDIDNNKEQMTHYSNPNDYLTHVKNIVDE